jgi:hypothetical protein
MVGTYPTHDWMLTAITSKVTRYRKHIAILVLELDSSLRVESGQYDNYELLRLHYLCSYTASIYCVVLCSTVQYCVVLCGTVWYCVVMCGTSIQWMHTDAAPHKGKHSL